LERGFDVEGHVVNEEGEPVEGVMADLDPLGKDDITDWMRFAALKHFSHIPDMASTDSEGIFRVLRVPAGDYKVTLVHREYYPDPGNPPLKVGPQCEGWLGVLNRGMVVQGSVVDSEGQPLPGVTVTLARIDDERRSIKGLSKVLKTLEDGTFRALGVAPGEYEAVFLAGSDFAPHAEDVHSLRLPNPWRVVITERRPPAEGNEGVLWLELKDGVRPAPEGEARVRLYRLPDLSLRTPIAGKVRAGELHETGVAPGAYRAVIAVSGYAPAVLASITVAPHPERPVRVLLSGGAATVFAIEGPAKPGVLEIREPSLEVAVAELAWPSVGSQGLRLTARLEPGQYKAILKVGGENPFDRDFVVEGTEGEPALTFRPQGKAAPMAERKE
jgi:hypothetical protein